MTTIKDLIDNPELIDEIFLDKTEKPDEDDFYEKLGELIEESPIRNPGLYR